MGEELRDLVVAIGSNWNATGQQDKREVSTSVPRSLPGECPSLCQKICEMGTAAGTREQGLELGEMREKTQCREKVQPWD